MLYYGPLKMKDRIFIEGLQTRCLIGIFDWERKVKQKILIDLEFPADVKKAARRDRIEDTINYKEIAKLLLREVPQTRFQLVESLAEFIAQRCLEKFNLAEITVRVSKPGAIRGSRNVGITVTRARAGKSQKAGSSRKI